MGKPPTIAVMTIGRGVLAAIAIKKLEDCRDSKAAAN
jgi:hypothetical protein